MEHNPGRFGSLVIDTAVVVLTLGPILYLAVEYPDLPQRIPVHWSASGEPDRWSEKNPASVFLAGVVGCLGQLMLWLISKDLSDSIRMQARSEAKAAFLRACWNMMQPMRIALGFMLIMVSVNLPLSIHPPPVLFPRLFFWTMMGSMALLLLPLLYLFRVYRLQKECEKAATPGDPEFDKAGWRWGGVVYYNPKDPGFIVYRKVGVGFTCNFAHPRIKLYGVVMALMLAVPIISIALRAV
jgi:uncharacterized membrane protein